MPTTPQRLPRVTLGRVARLGLATLLLTVGVAVAVAPTQATTARAAAAAQPGTAIAQTSVFGVAPVVSGASLTVTVGTSQAQYQSTSAEASSQVINPGGLGQILKATKICGQSFPAGSLPGALQADTTDKPSTRAHATVASGTEDIAVASSPLHGSATTKPVAVSLPGLASVTGETTAAVGFAAGTGTSTATATNQISLLGGVITITGAKWTASQQYGTSRHSQAGFTFGGIAIKPLPALPLSPLTVTARQGVAAALKIVNAALAPIGVTLSQPTRQIAKQSNAVSISPLEIYLSGSSLDRALSTPVFTAFHQIEQALTGTLPNTTSCAQLAGVIHSFQGPFDSIFAVISGGIEGSGGLSIDVGGATANVSPPTNYTDPFAGGSGDNPLATTPSAPPTGTTTAPSTGTGSGPLPNPPAAGTTGQGTTSSGPPPLVAGKTSVICRSLNTATGAHCSFGHAVPVAAVAIALGGGLLAADLVTGRSRRRTRRRARA